MSRDEDDWEADAGRSEITLKIESAPSWQPQIEDETPAIPRRCRPSAGGRNSKAAAVKLEAAAQFAECSPKCRTNRSKSRSLYNDESSFSMQLVAISVSIVFRIVIPRVLSLRKFLAA